MLLMKFMMSYCGGSFQVLRDRMTNGDQGVPKPKLGDAPLHPQEILKKTQASKLGDAPVHPLLRQ